MAQPRCDISSFTINPGVREGDEVITVYVNMPVTFTAIGDLQEIVSHTWFVGDGQVNHDNQFEHTFTVDGIYDVTHTVCDIHGAKFTTLCPVSAYKPYHSGLQLTLEESQIDVCQCTTVYVSLTSSQPGPYDVTLYSDGSSSAPARKPILFWDHLIPQWKFTDLDDNIIDKLTLESQPIKMGDHIVGWHSWGCAKYCDDMPGDVVIKATVDQSQCQTNVPFVDQATLTIQPVAPDTLWILSDGKQDLPSVTWEGATIPYVVVVGAQQCGKRPLHYLCGTVDVNIPGQRPQTLAINHENENCLTTGGFARGVTSVCQATSQTTLTGIATIKYQDTITSVTGKSTEFVVKPAYDENSIRVNNESYDLADKIRQYLPPAVLERGPKFFDEYLQALTGPASDPHALGTALYERIANFTDNHGDVDTQTIDTLKATATKLDVGIDDFSLTFPPELKRLMDMFSVHYSDLWGVRCQCNMTLETMEDAGTEGLPCSICKQQKRSNIGSKIVSPYHYEVSVGDKVVYKRNGSKIYHLYEVTPIYSYDNQQAIDDVNNGPFVLSDISHELFIQPVADNYQFWQYDPTPAGNLLYGSIDWNNPDTLLSPATSLDQWYATGGIVEQIISCHLTSKLGLLDSSCQSPQPSKIDPPPCDGEPIKFWPPVGQPPPSVESTPSTCK